MIGYLKGTVMLLDGSSLIIDVNGVGYKVTAASNLLTTLHLDTEAAIFIHTHVREDQLELYGFASHGDLKLFEYFIGVSGIGPKTAIGIFSLGTSSEILQALRKADVDFFTGVPRLGRKNAQKLIIELKNKIGGEGDLALDGEENTISSDTVQALLSIGFSEKEAREAVRKIGDRGENVNEKVKLALKQLGR